MPKWLTSPITDIWPDLSEAHTAKVTRWIDQAERLIAQRFRTIDQRIEEGYLDPIVVADVVEAMVTRALDTYTRGGMDKLAYPEVSMEWDNSGGAGNGSTLFLTIDELMLLSPSESTAAFTICKTPRPRLATPTHTEVNRRW